jgi:hypothetical protein
MHLQAMTTAIDAAIKQNQPPQQSKFGICHHLALISLLESLRQTASLTADLSDK